MGKNNNNNNDNTTTKPKEMLVDFRRQSVINQFSIYGIDIEHVDRYKCLGTGLDHSLTFNDNTDAIFRKCQKRLFFLQKTQKHTHGQ